MSLDEFPHIAEDLNLFREGLSTKYKINWIFIIPIPDLYKLCKIKIFLTICLYNLNMLITLKRRLIGSTIRNHTFKKAFQVYRKHNLNMDSPSMHKLNKKKTSSIEILAERLNVNNGLITINIKIFREYKKTIVSLNKYSTSRKLIMTLTHLNWTELITEYKTVCQDIKISSVKVILETFTK